VDSGSWTESTYRANERDFAAICFRQRVAVNIENRSVRSTMIGEDVAMPVALAPTGLCGMQHAWGYFFITKIACIISILPIGYARVFLPWRAMFYNRRGS
jgi:L-lactate dehydrogenase (cytochrome)